MVVVGADVHKRTHTFVGVDKAARQLGHKTSRSLLSTSALVWPDTFFRTRRPSGPYPREATPRQRDRSW